MHEETLHSCQCLRDAFRLQILIYYRRRLFDVLALISNQRTGELA